MNAYLFFRYLHSGFRYIVLLLLVLAIVSAWANWIGKKPYSEGQRKLNLFTMISVHTQLLIGLILYFLSPNVKFVSGVMKDNTLRYWTVEHIAGMLIAVVLITIGHSRSKKAATADKKHKAVATFYTIAVLVIVATLLSAHSGILLGMTH
ncbi:MAG: cytochrome B [Bacteroidetes bacterium]|nr:cytochrome B [Bacteroidota bacterium]